MTPAPDPQVLLVLTKSGAADKPTTSAPTTGVYDVHRGLLGNPTIPSSAKLIAKHGSWAKAMNTYDYTHIASETLGEFEERTAAEQLAKDADDARQAKLTGDLEKLRADRPAPPIFVPAPEAPAIGSGALTFEIPWREVVYGTTTVKADSYEQALEAFNNADHTADSGRGAEIFYDEIREINQAS
jgi:hypothetical protein